MQSSKLLILAMVAFLADVSLAALPRGPEAHISYSYDEYLSEFPEKSQRLQANPEEYLTRKAIFEAELADVVKHNSENHPWRKGLNQFSDMTMEEFMMTATGDLIQEEQELDLRKWGQEQEINQLLGVTNNDLTAVETNLPPSVDWSARGRSHVPRAQGKCGSCWSFVGASLLDYYASAQAGRHITLSTQQAVECFPNPRQCGGSGGCKGYTAAHLIDQYAKDVGLVLEEAYPYTSGEAGVVGECKFNPETMHVAVKTAGAKRLTPNNPSELLRALAFQGPVAVSVSGTGIKSYYDGVLTKCDSGFNEKYQKYEVILSHAMIAVGYGVNDKGMGYWKLANSWGPDWARDGTAYIYRPLGEAEGVYINTKPSSGYTCADEDQSPFPVAGTCGVLANSWVPLGVQYIPKPPTK